MSNSKTLNATTLVKSTVLAALMVFTASAVAQQQDPEMSPGEPSELLQRVQEAQAEIQQLNQQLAEIQQATIEANPELAEERDELMATVDAKMEEAGHDPAASRDRIDELRGELESGELSTEESQAVSQELRQEQTSMRQAQGHAMQDPEVQGQIQTLNEQLIAAMREQNEQTQELISQLQEAQREYQQLMQEAMQKHGGGNPGQG